MRRIVPAGVSPRVLCAVVAVPWSLFDLDTTRGIRGLADFCSTPIKVSNAPYHHPPAELTQCQYG